MPHLSMSLRHAEFTEEFLDRLNAITILLPPHECEPLNRLRMEPYRQMFTIIRRKLEVTREQAHHLWEGVPPNPMVYTRAEELAADLEAVDESLRTLPGPPAGGRPPVTPAGLYQGVWDCTS